MRPYVRAANVGWGGLLLDDVKSMNFTDAEMEVYGLRPGDLLLNEASGSAREVGKPVIWSGEIEDCAFQNTLIRVRPTGADPRYLLHYFAEQASSGAFARKSRGVGIYHLGREALAASLVPMPPFEEQRRIAAVLDEAGELRTKRETSLALIDSLNESIFLDMFGSGAYKRASLGDHLAFLTSGSRGWARYYADSGAPFLRIQNVLRDRLDMTDVARVEAPENAEARRTRVRGGDVLMSITADLGRTCVVPPELDGAFINQHLCLMRTETLDPRFVSAFLTSADAVVQIRRKNRAAVKAGLNFDDVRSLQIPVPPLPEQRAFAVRAAEVDRRREALEVGLAGFHELFASLQHRAFVGQL